MLRDQVARLQRSCHRLIWLNPLIGTADYAPLTRGLQAALPYVDDFLPARTLTNLADLALHLNALAVGDSSRSLIETLMDITGYLHIQRRPRSRLGAADGSRGDRLLHSRLRRFEPAGEDRYRARLTVALAAITGSYEGTIVITDKVPHSSYRLTAEGQGSPAS